MKFEKILLYVVFACTAVFSFCFSLFAIQPALLYHHQQIAWQSTTQFANYYLQFSGGLGEYMALFVSQFFYSNWLGGLIITLSSFLISWFIYRTFKSISKKEKLLFLLIPIIQIIILALTCNYRFSFSVTLNLLIVSASIHLCAIISSRIKFKIDFHILITGLLIYYISGGAYFLIFMLSSFLLLFRKGNSKVAINAMLIIIEAFLIPLIAFKFVFLSSLNSSFFRSIPDVAVMLRYHETPLFYLALLIIPFFILITVVSSLRVFGTNNVKKYSAKKASTKRNRNSSVSKTNTKTTSKRKVVLVVEILILIAASYSILNHAYQPVERKKIEIEYFANQQNWEKVISLSKELNAYDQMVNFQYNRAIAHSGEMLEKLFYYEQLLGVQGLFLDKPFVGEVALPNSDIYFDLGNIDESQRYAFEAQTLIPNSPSVLKRLILNCMVLGNMQAANTYLNVLAANPMEKKFVKKYSPYLTNSNLIDQDIVLAEKKRNRGKAEGLYVTPRTKLLSQLERNPLNKTAFEYLIAFDLMEHDLVSFTEDLSFMSAFNSTKIPTVVEEAVILFRSQKRDNNVLNQMQISEATKSRFRKFAALTQASKGNKEKAKQTTLEFKDTYWYYVLFQSPLVTNIKLSTKPEKANY